MILTGTIYYRLNRKHEIADRLSGISTLSEEIQETAELSDKAVGEK
jgi:hypothetical protein